MAAALAGHAVSVLAAQGVTSAVAVGYGTDAAVSPVAAALRERAAAAGIAMTELLRAENGRYWSYVCANPACCPPEGTPFDVTGASGGARPGGGRRPACWPAGTSSPRASPRRAGQLGAAMRRATAKAPAQVARAPPALSGKGCRSPRRRLTGHTRAGGGARRHRAATATGERSPPSTRPG